MAHTSDSDPLSRHWCEGHALRWVVRPWVTVVDGASLTGPGELLDSSRRDVIADIEAGTQQYFVAEQAPAVLVLVRSRNGGKYITTEADSTSKNNLDNLPLCTRA